LTAFRVKLVDFGSDGVYQGGNDVEFEVTRTPTLSGWNRYDTSIGVTGLTTKSTYCSISIIRSTSGTVYIDNVYFSKVASTPLVLKRQKVMMYPNPVSNVLTINSTIENVSIYNILGQEVLLKIKKQYCNTSN
jgi:hypothetical protein